MTIDLIVVSCEEIFRSYYIVDWSYDFVGVAVDVIVTSDGVITWSCNGVEVSSDYVAISVYDVVIDLGWFAVDIASISAARSSGAGRGVGDGRGSC